MHLLTVTVKTRCITWPELPFDFNQSITAVCKEILCFSEVDADHSQQQMTRCPQAYFHLQNHSTHSNTRVLTQYMCDIM